LKSKSDFQQQTDLQFQSMSTSASRDDEKQKQKHITSVDPLTGRTISGLQTYKIMFRTMYHRKFQYVVG